MDKKTSKKSLKEIIIKKNELTIFELKYSNENDVDNFIKQERVFWIKKEGKSILKLQIDTQTVKRKRISSNKLRPIMLFNEPKIVNQ